MENSSPLDHTRSLPWATDLDSLLASANDHPDASCCLFTVESVIPLEARAGFAALVLAYGRDGEPVAILDDGTALVLVTSGGLDAAKVVATRVLDQMARLGLSTTLRAAVAPVAGDPSTLLARALESGSAVIRAES